MKYVLDASVGMKWLLPEDDSDKAIALQEQFERGVHQLIAPDVFPIEIAHALTRAERRGILIVPEGTLHFTRILRTLPDLHPSFSLLARAFEISSQTRIGVYDCLYVALAEQEGCEFITADEKLVRNLPDHPLVPLSSL